VYEVKFKGEGKPQKVVEANLHPQLVKDFWTAQTDAKLEQEIIAGTGEGEVCKKMKSAQYEKKKFHTAGLLAVVGDNGIIIRCNELYVSEACSQVHAYYYVSAVVNTAVTVAPAIIILLLLFLSLL
jgi:hypothetical protein